MPGAFALELDTQAPSLIAWHAPGSVGVGQELWVRVELDEPAVAEARLELGDQELEMAVESDLLHVSLPSDLAPGVAMVRALVRDELLNEGLAFSPQIAISALAAGGAGDRSAAGEAGVGARGHADRSSRGEAGRGATGRSDTGVTRGK